jgi:hypothetical protein
MFQISVGFQTNPNLAKGSIVEKAHSLTNKPVVLSPSKHERFGQSFDRLRVNGVPVFFLIRLHFLEEWSLQEIADLLDKEIGAIHGMKSRALAKLRKICVARGLMQEK